jgi:Flp pilus assembly protein TadD
MLTTKNEREEGKGKTAISWLRLLFLVVFAAALAGCGPPGAHALLKGKKLLQEGDYADAADEFKDATEVMATNAEAWNYLGVAEQHAGQFEEAANAYQRALELDRDLTEAHYNLGCLWMDENKPDDAVSEFTSYTLRRVNEPDGWLKLGLAQLRAGDVLTSEKSFSTALYLSPNNAEALNGLGLARMKRSRPEEAQKFFQAAVQAHPDYAPAILNLATVEHEYLRNDQFALDEYRAYLTLNPRPANWDEVNAIAASLDQTPAAAAAPSAETQQYPPAWQNSAPAENTAPPEQEAMRPQKKKEHRSQAVRDNAQEETDETSPAPTETEQVPPDTTIVSAHNSAPKPARQNDMSGSVETNPQNANNNGGQGNYNPPWFHFQPLQEQGNVKVTPLPPENYSGSPAPVHIVQPAPPSYPRYLYLSPRKPAPGDRHAASTMFARAREDEAARRFTDALDSYRRATRFDPSWFEAQYNCGVLAYRLSDYQSSLKPYEMALAIHPDSLDARYNFALALKAADYVPDAVDELKKILASHPNDARIHLELGNIYAQKLRDVPRAHAEYLKVLQLDPGNPQASNIEFWLSANPQ